MSSRQRSELRHCPVCGVAMQASKSRPDLLHFDTFECGSCRTVVRESKSGTVRGAKPATPGDERK